MDQFDEMLRERAMREPCPIPADYAGRVFAVCAALDETEETPKQKRTARHRWPVWAAAVLALFIAVPNVSPAAAAAMADMPVLGAIVEVITFHRYTYDDGHGSANVTVPELSGSDAAQEVSNQVQAYTDQLILQFQKDCETLGESYESLDVTSAVITDTDSWFTLRVDAEEIQASGYQFSRFYHIDKANGQVVTLKDLFREDIDYVTALSDEVRRQMEEQMAENPEVSYFPEEFTAIDPDQNFYWAADGSLVLVFDEYTIVPGFMGMPEFTIPADVYQNLLK